MSVSITYFVVAFAILVGTPTANGANILALFPSPSPSHLIMEMAVVRAMVEREHNVTVISVLPLKPDMLDPRITYIKLNSGLANMELAIKTTTTKGFGKITKMLGTLRTLSESVSEILDDAEFLKFLHNKGNKYDLLLFGYIYADFLFGVGAHFNCPIALLWPNQPMPYMSKLIGNPFEMSYIPMAFTSDIDRNRSISFKFRILNALCLVTEQIMTASLNSWMKSVYDTHFPADKYITYEEAQQSVSMILYSHHFSEKPIRPLVPGMIEIGGIQLNDEIKPLPRDIANFLDSATEHGAIFFSLGTNARKEHLESDTLQKIYNVFSKLPQKVLWKCESVEDVPGNASNILYKSWLPQSDILAHPNIRLFFNHGGKGGITEAQFRGVPMVGMPIFADQPINLREVTHNGYGVVIEDFKTMTEIDVHRAVMEVLENSKYRSAVQKFSKLYRDRPLSAKDNTVYWLEYVIRHKGAPHMQSPLKSMNLVEKYNLDVIFSLLLIVYIIFKFLKVCFSIILKKICQISRKKLKTN